MEALGLNEAAATVGDRSQRAKIGGGRWARWTPVNAAAIGAHLIGDTGLVIANEKRVDSHAGVGHDREDGLAGAALVAAAYARAIDKYVGTQQQIAQGATEPSNETPSMSAADERRRNALKWAIPTLTGRRSSARRVAVGKQRPTSMAAAVLDRMYK